MEMQMASSVHSDHIDLTLMGGFDVGIDFEGFEENMKKIMELPIKYLDSAHDKAVELIEDVHTMLWDPFADGEVPNKPHETFEDPSSSNTIAGSSPTSVETELVRVNAEVSTPASFITMENGSTDCIDMDAHGNESVLIKSPENSLKGDHIEAKDPCLLPADTLTTELYDSTTSEEIILWNPDNSAKQTRQPEPTTISEDNYVPRALDTGKVTEQVGLHCSSHSDIRAESSVFYNSSANCEEQMVLQGENDPVEATTTHGLYPIRASTMGRKAETNSHGLSRDVSRFTDDSTMDPDCTANSVAIPLRNGQQNMESDKLERSYVRLRPNTSFKKMFMRNLSNKLWRSKKLTSVAEDVPDRSQDGENPGYQVVSLSDGLDDDWEVL